MKKMNVKPPVLPNSQVKPIQYADNGMVKKSGCGCGKKKKSQSPYYPPYPY